MTTPTAPGTVRPRGCPAGPSRAHRGHHVADRGSGDDARGDNTPDDHPDRAGYLSNLGGALRDLAERTGDTTLLTEAVAISRAAVDDTPDDHPDRAGYLSNLGGALRDLAERTGDTTLLTEAVAISRAAVDDTPDDHPDRAGYLSNLGGALRDLAERTGDTTLLTEAARFLWAGSYQYPGPRRSTG